MSDKKLTGLVIDSSGRVELTDEQLQSIEQTFTAQAIAGGSNTSCTNEDQCMDTTNRSCTNINNCDGATNTRICQGNQQQ